MKTNVSIDLTDDQRRHLADLVDGKVTKRLITRSEVVALCQQHVAGLIGDQFDSSGEKVKNNLLTPAELSLFVPDREDEAILRGKSPGYIRGWNLVKRGKKQ